MFFRQYSLLSALVAALLLPMASYAHDHHEHNTVELHSGDLHIEHPWARASAGNATNGAAYLTIQNHGKSADSLSGAASPVAHKVELHTHLNENGMMAMRQVNTIDVEPGASIELKPGSLHLMLVGLKAPLKEGDRFPLILTFREAGDIKVEVVVQKAGAGTDVTTTQHRH